ncbi:MAG: hypothetical protein AMXMBFR83_13060 [Phycisphaerae bacterium]
MTVLALLSLWDGRLFGAEPTVPPDATYTTVRSRRMELHYRIHDAPEGVQVRLWYTRDRGATWRLADTPDGRAHPLLFTAPAEGLFGVLLTVDVTGSTPVPPPANSPPQRWLFVDGTPPLAQWDGVEPADDFPTRRVLRLRWTAYDDHLIARPVALSFQSTPAGGWQSIEAAVANTGRFDWTVPAEVSGPVSVKLTVADRGGNVVERVCGPLPIERWLKPATTGTRPAPATSTRPAQEPMGPPAPTTRPAAIDLERRLKARNLLKQGEFHAERGQYAVAVERFREALEADPDSLAALSNLAGVYHLMEQYDKALELYRAVLARDGRNIGALRGAALAHVAREQYPQSRDLLRQLLAVNAADAQACFDLGDVLYLMGDTAEAREQWRRATLVDPAAGEIISKARQRLATYGVPLNADAPRSEKK